MLELKKIETTIDKLQSHPFLGRKSTELKDDLIYELVFQNYKIIYEVLSDREINILTIHHHARAITNNPAFTDED